MKRRLPTTYQGETVWAAISLPPVTADTNRHAPRRPHPGRPAAAPDAAPIAASANRRAPQPGHEDPPAPARLPDITPVSRPEHQRPGTRRAARPGELHATASRHVGVDRERAGPYDGHGRHRLGSLLAIGAKRGEEGS